MEEKEQFKDLELKNQLELFEIDFMGFTALVHLSLEGIRSDSVDPNEIKGSIAILYQLSETLLHRMKDIRQKFLL